MKIRCTKEPYNKDKIKWLIDELTELDDIVVWDNADELVIDVIQPKSYIHVRNIVVKIHDYKIKYKLE